VIAWLDRLRSTTEGARLFERVSPWLVIALAAFLRLFELGSPAKLVFDETYYVKDAWSLWNTGAERNWPAGYNEKFESGAVNGFLADPSFVVHPPLGKWLIGLGMWLGGAENAWSWRIAVALIGTATVGLVFVVGKQVLRSHSWALLAAFFMAIEGQAIVMSRVALLDGMLGFFALLAFWFVLRDREAMLAAIDSGRLAPRWARPWLVAAGIALGAASAVKWSGAYFLAAFGLYAVGSEIVARIWREPNDDQGRLGWGWLRQGTGQALIDFALLVPIALGTYLASWAGWLLTADGYDRTSSSNPLIALLNYHRDAYTFHVNLRTPHSYQANPLTWLFMQRPTSMFYEGWDEGKNGCYLPSGCSTAVDPVPNPLIWYAAAAAILWLAYRWLLERDRAMGQILVGVAAGYLPWMLYLNRTVFEFYTVAFEPWLMLALAFALRHFVNSRLPERRNSARIAVGYFAGAAFALTLFFLPIWIGTQVPHWYWQIHMWLPSWI